VTKEELIVDPLSWWRENRSSKFLWEEESGLRPWFLLKKKKESLSEHHDLARGWPVVNPSRSCCAYGWVEKGTPFSSCITIWFLDKYIWLNLCSV
jgi:hypothetical protein